MPEQTVESMPSFTEKDVYTANILLPWEDEHEFVEFILDGLRFYNPKTPHETTLVQIILRTQWLRRRCDLYEQRVLSGGGHNEELNTAAFQDPFSFALARVFRYRSSLDLSIQRSQNALEKARKLAQVA